jgi:hypothetical protein
MNLLSRFYLIELVAWLGFSKLLLISREMSQCIGVMISNSGLHLRLIMSGIKQIIGLNRDNNIPRNMIGVIFTHEPGGGSTNNVMHWIQCFRSRRTFCRFDYGATRNLQMYGQKESP